MRTSSICIKHILTEDLLLKVLVQHDHKIIVKYFVNFWMTVRARWCYGSLPFRTVLYIQRQ